MEAPLLGDSREIQDLKQIIWIESKKLWFIVGPAIFCRISIYSMNVITQAFAGHLGETELAAISIVNNVITGFTFGLLVLLHLNFVYVYVFICVLIYVEVLEACH